ncbi:arylesterase [Nitrospira sp. M1]
MIASGCDTADEQTLPSSTTFSAENSDQHTNSAVATTTRPNKHATHSAKDTRPRIVALGDSLTAGLGVPPDESYPSRLQRHLDQTGYPYHVVNAGVSGDTTAGALRRLDWVLKNQPSIVIIELGANDGLRGQPIKAIHGNLQKILQRLQDRQIHILLTGMKIPPNYGFDYTSQFAEIFPQLADEFDVPFMPFFLEDVAAHRSLNQADGIHPTGEGYKVIVEHLMTYLEPLLRAQPPRTS